MSRLDVLPMELLLHIAGCVEGEQKYRTLKNLCLASKDLYTAALPSLYRVFENWEVVNSKGTSKERRTTLHLLLRTLCERPELADHVKELHLNTSVYRDPTIPFTAPASLIDAAESYMPFATRLTPCEPGVGRTSTPSNYAQDEWCQDLRMGTTEAETILLLCIVANKLEHLSILDSRHIISPSPWPSCFPKLKSVEFRGKDWWHPIDISKCCGYPYFSSLTTFRSEFGALVSMDSHSEPFPYLSQGLRSLELDTCRVDIALLSLVIRQCHALERLTLIAIPRQPTWYSYRELHPALLTQKDSLRHLKLVSLKDDSVFDEAMSSRENTPAVLSKLESLDVGASVITPVKAPGEEASYVDVLPTSLQSLSVQYPSWTSLIFHLREMLSSMRREEAFPRLRYIHAMLKIIPSEVDEIDAVKEGFREMGISLRTSARYA